MEVIVGERLLLQTPGAGLDDELPYEKEEHCVLDVCAAESFAAPRGLYRHLDKVVPVECNLRTKSEGAVNQML